MVKITLEEFLGKKGLAFPVSDYTLDKCKFPHGLTERQRRKLGESTLNQADEYQNKRRDAIKEYWKLVEQGEIVPKTYIEKLIDHANGHPDKESTQAARRMCEKRGVCWQSN